MLALAIKVETVKKKIAIHRTANKCICWLWQFTMSMSTKSEILVLFYHFGGLIATPVPCTLVGLYSIQPVQALFEKSVNSHDVLDWLLLMDLTLHKRKVVVFELLLVRMINLSSLILFLFAKEFSSQIIGTPTTCTLSCIFLTFFSSLD